MKIQKNNSQNTTPKAKQIIKSTFPAPVTDKNNQGNS